MKHVHYVIEYDGEIEAILHTVEEVEADYIDVNEYDKEQWEAFKLGNVDFYTEDDYDALHISRIIPRS